MNTNLAIAGLGLNLVGAIILLLADTWFSRSVLIYLDALEDSLLKITEMLQRGSGTLQQFDIDLKRDRNQNRARFTKLLGWVFMIGGFLLQLSSLASTGF